MNIDDKKILKDLGDLVTSTKASVINFVRPAEYGLSSSFTDALTTAFPDYSFEFYERTIKVRTPAGQYIYVSGQSFALAECLMDFCEEIGIYRSTAYQILNRYREDFSKIVRGEGRLDEIVFTALRDNSNQQLATLFKTKSKEYFVNSLGNSDEEATQNVNHLLKFLTDYNWWLGGKQINRSNDWAISPISTLLNMPQNDSNFIARAVSRTTEDTGFRNAFKQAIKYEWLQNGPDNNSEDNHSGDSGNTIAENILLYGVPGCGKSYTIKTNYCDDDNRMERVVFHPDYSNSDFIGQILPQNINGDISYPFIPGPFTRILKKANDNPDTMYYLIIEEINRGNAPAIFGEVFQLLDRVNGESEYGISNADIAKEVYGNPDQKVKIPSNLTILATMNTADQNVFTLDTAFKRRWKMINIPNDFEKCKLKDHIINGTNITWQEFAETINGIIENNLTSMSSEDKRLGAYFVSSEELDDKKQFSEKVLAYLWDDVFKYDNKDKVFDPSIRTLDVLVNKFQKNPLDVFYGDALKDLTIYNNDSK